MTDDRPWPTTDLTHVDHTNSGQNTNSGGVANPGQNTNTSSGTKQDAGSIGMDTKENNAAGTPSDQKEDDGKPNDPGSVAGHRKHI